MIIRGNMNYDQHGRKRKKKATTTKRRSSSGLRHQSLRLETRDHAPHASPQIPSAELKPYSTAKDTSYKKEISKQYTVAVAYNKGAYQVIPRDDVKHIGK